MANKVNLENEIASVEEIEAAYKDAPLNLIEKELEKVEDIIKEKQGHLERFNALKTLSETNEFKTLFDKGYFEEEKNRVTELIVGTQVESGNVEYIKRDVLQNLTDKLLSMRNLKIYFSAVVMNGQSAEIELEELNRIKSVLEKKIKFGGK